MRAVLAAAALAVFAPAEAKALSYNKRELAKADFTHEWPFTVEKGELVCLVYAGQKHVLFSEPDPNPGGSGYGPGYVASRTIIVSTNPMGYLANVEDRSLLAPFDNDLAVLVRRMAPLEALGRELCDQPQTKQE